MHVYLAYVDYKYDPCIPEFDRVDNGPQYLEVWALNSSLWTHKKVESTFFHEKIARRAVACISEAQNTRACTQAAAICHWSSADTRCGHRRITEESLFTGICRDI